MNRSLELLPEDYVDRQVKRQKIVRWSVILFASILAVLSVGFLLNMKAAKLEVALEPLRQNIESLESWEMQITPLAERLSDGHLRQIVAQDLFNEPLWSGLLYDFSEATNHDLWITEFVMRKVVLSTEEEEDEEENDGKQVSALNISGEATSNKAVVLFLETFSRSRHLDQLNLEESKSGAAVGRQCNVYFKITGIVK